MLSPSAPFSRAWAAQSSAHCEGSIKEERQQTACAASDANESSREHEPSEKGNQSDNTATTARIAAASGPPAARSRARPRARARSALVCLHGPHPLPWPAARKLLQMRREAGAGPQEEDHGGAAGADLPLPRDFRHGLEGAVGGPLLRRRGGLDQGHRRRPRGTMLQQAAADVAEQLQAHVEDRRLLAGALGQLRPVQLRQLLGLALARDQPHAAGAELPVRQGHLAGGRGPYRGGHPGHHLRLHAMLREELELLATAAEDERVAALQPHDPATAPAIGQHELVDLALLKASIPHVAAALANVYQLGGRWHQGKDVLGEQAVVQHDVRSLQPPQGLERQQLGVPRPGADEGDGAPGRGLRRLGRREAVAELAGGHGEAEDCPRSAAQQRRGRGGPEPSLSKMA
mmetsp:Transcript_4284/g.13360  ORF Transcript_4284/g.13360 Transcript_4284/m.13360 type:complete len:403 (-) Transcript_4284:3-1211(-)